MQLNKSIKIFLNYCLGPFLFLWLSYSIYTQIQNQSHLEASWLHIKRSFQSLNALYLVGAVGLMFVNWGLEAAKWRLAVRVVYPISFWQSFKAVLSGVSFTVTTPNRVGEYLGRMLYMPEGKRLQVISLTVICSMSQLLVTLLIGTASFFILGTGLIKAGIISALGFRFIAFGLVAMLVLLALFYFNLAVLERWLERWAKGRTWLYLVHAIQAFDPRRLGLLVFLSAVRYGVFAAQYLLLFRLFEVAVPVGTAFGLVSLVFLALAIIPSIALIEVGLRGEVSLQLIGLFAANHLGILLTSVTVWFLNLIVPALAGSLLILSVRLFRQRGAKDLPVINDQSRRALKDRA